MIKGKVAIIGTGNMGGAMLRGMVGQGAVPAGNVYIYDANASLAERLGKELFVNVCESEENAVSSADYVFIAVKPDIVYKVAEKIKKVISGKCLITIAAGRSTKVYADIFGDEISKNTHIVRAIPNLPAMVGQGMSGIFFNGLDDENIKNDIRELFSGFGKYTEVKKESDIDSMIAVTSSSPAYVCLLVEAMADAAVLAGFKREEAYLMVEQTILGTCDYLMKEKIHPAVLKDMICSPGGTTIEAVKTLEQEGFRSAVMEAMKACDKKAKGM